MGGLACLRTHDLLSRATTRTVPAGCRRTPASGERGGGGTGYDLTAGQGSAGCCRARAPATSGAWTRLPAVRAGQVHPWYPAAPYSYRTYAPLYRDIAARLATAHVLDQG